MPATGTYLYFLNKSCSRLFFIWSNNILKFQYIGPQHQAPSFPVNFPSFPVISHQCPLNVRQLPIIIFCHSLSFPVTSCQLAISRHFQSFPIKGPLPEPTPTKSDQIRPNPTKSDQIRPNPAQSGRIRRSDSVGVASGRGPSI